MGGSFCTRSRTAGLQPPSGAEMAGPPMPDGQGRDFHWAGGYRQFCTRWPGGRSGFLGSTGTTPPRMLAGRLDQPAGSSSSRGEQLARARWSTPLGGDVPGDAGF